MTEPESSSPPASQEDGASGRVEIVLSYLLRIGVALSILILLAGVATLFVRHPDDLSRPQNLHELIAPGAQFPHTVGQVVHRFDGVSGRALAAAGLLVLILTPVMRVAVSVVAFLIERDWAYVGLTSLVLILLLLSFLVGAAG